MNLKSKPAIIFIIAVLVIVSIGAYFYMTNSNTKNPDIKSKETKVELETNYGNIVIALYSDMPVTAGNFEKLVSEGFYDGVIFHRIIDGFMIQGGDPTGTGMGGPGYQIKDEFNHAGGNNNKRGTISMANSGPDTGGSQFFINLANNNFLDTKHPAFGEVVDGMDVIDKIAKVATDENDKPIEPVTIISAKIVE
jgi:peptidylprolyl isomerase